MSNESFFKFDTSNSKNITYVTDNSKEEINMNIFENINNLTGVPNVQPKANDLITGNMARHDYDKLYSKDSLLQIAIAYCCGLAVFGRFSSIVCENSNSTFLITYLIMVIFTVYPITFLDMTLGQYTSKGPLLVFDYCPLLEGVGYSMTIFCLVQPLPIVMNIVYSISYMLLALSPELPWASCSAIEHSLSLNNATGCDNTPSSTKNIPVVYFWKSYMQRGCFQVASVSRSRWYWLFFLNQILFWLFISYSLYKGSRSAYKVIRVILLPSVCFLLVIFAISIRTIDLPSTSIYWIPSWSQFLNPNIWTEATIQAFLSIGASSGILLTLSVNYDFRDKFVHKHILIIIAMGVIVNILMAIFFFINVNAVMENYKANFHDVFPNGINFVYLIFPEKIKHWIFPQFFIIIFYFACAMLQSIAVIILLETFKLCIFSKIPYIAEHKTFWTFIMCTIYLLVALLNTSGCAAGYISEAILSTVIRRTLIFIGLFELISIFIIYGSNKFITDVDFMRNSRPTYFLRICWFTNILFLTIMGVLIMKMQYTQFNLRQMDKLLGVIIQNIILLPIPIIMVLNIYKFLKIRNLVGVLKPRSTAGPKYGIFKAMRESFDGIEH